MKSYKYYIFDFDLTLMDTVKGITDSVRHVILDHPELDCVPSLSTDYLKQIIGMSLENSFRFLVPGADDEMIADFAQEYKAAADVYMIPGTTPYENTGKVLKELKQRGAFIGICSLKIRSRVADALEKYGLLEYVDCILGSESMTNPKPHPEGLLAVMERLEVKDSGEVLYVGDSIYDAGCAANAGVDFAGVTTGNADADVLKQYPNVAIVSDIGDLLD